MSVEVARKTAQRRAPRVGALFAIVVLSAVSVLSLAFALGARPEARAQGDADDPTREPQIGVLLRNAPEDLILAADGDAAMHVAWVGERGSQRKQAREALRVRFRGGSAWIGRDEIQNPFRVAVVDDGKLRPIRMGDRLYEGVLDFFPDRRESGVTWKVVNRLPLERYLLGVLPHEMGESFPKEALRAQAVASRTYALYHLLRQGHSCRYHVRGDTSSQVYGGKSHGSRVRWAVESTRGQVLTFRNQVFESFYHSTCGGWTASANAMLGGGEIPPLEASRCGSCKASKFYRWSVEVPARDLHAVVQKIVRPHSVDLGKIRSISPVDPGPGKHAAYLQVRHARGSFEVDANRVRLGLIARGIKGLRSTAFKIEPVAGGYRFEGRGWGHGAGMCQMGATGLAVSGGEYADILLHYYQGARIRVAYR